MIERRTFLCWMLTGAAALPARGIRLHAQSTALPTAGISTLHDVAPLVLPSELRPAGHQKVVNDFVQWLASYRSGAERSWGYGNPRRTTTPAIDASKYAAQLDALQMRARAQGGSWATATAGARRELVVEALEKSGVRDLPSSPNGQHVIADLMTFFYTSAPAFDLAYGASIRRGTCRGLGGSAARPLPATVGD